MREKIKLPALLPVILLAALMMPLLSACVKNDFSVEGTLTGAGSRTLSLIYTAYSDKHDELVTLRVPCTSDAFSARCATRYPTIMWIAAPDGTTLHALYAEHGDKIKISGSYNSPLDWQISGNKATEHYCLWLRQNKALIEGNNPRQINDAVAAAVRKNPDDPASALLLLTIYRRNSDEKGFHSLWQSLDLGDKEKERLLHVAMTRVDDAESKAGALTVTPLSLRDRSGAVVSINPAKARATILYFWRRKDGPHEGFLRVMASQPRDVQTADIFLDADTVQWRYMTQNDTSSSRTPLWAFGGEMNLSLHRLHIPSDPYFIVTDRRGRQLYRGNSAPDASAAASKAK